MTEPTDRDEPAPMTVDRCVCFDVTFAELKRYADRNGCGEDELRRQFKCGRGCGLCIPYLHAMLETGRVSFSATPPTRKPSRL